MSSAPEPPAAKKDPPKERNFENPGLRGTHTTTLFRAVNPELFIKPVRPASRRLVHFSVALGLYPGRFMPTRKAPKLVMLVHSCNPSPWETRVEG